MICAWDPDCIFATHPLPANEDVLEGVIQGMAQVELSCYIRGWDHNTEGLFILVHLCMKKTPI